MLEVPRVMRKGRNCYRCNTSLNVAFLGDDGNNYCGRCRIDIANSKEDQTAARIAKARGITIDSAYGELMKARARI